MYACLACRDRSRQASDNEGWTHVQHTDVSEHPETTAVPQQGHECALVITRYRETGGDLGRDWERLGKRPEFRASIWCSPARLVTQYHILACPLWLTAHLVPHDSCPLDLPLLSRLVAPCHSPPESYCLLRAADGRIMLRDSHRRKQVDFDSTVRGLCLLPMLCGACLRLHARMVAQRQGGCFGLPSIKLCNKPVQRACFNWVVWCD